MILGPQAILLYGSEKYIGGANLTSLFAVRQLFLPLILFWAHKSSLQMDLKKESQSTQFLQVF